MSRIPGFRSGRLWKKIVATFGYLMIFGMIVSAVNGGESNKTSPTLAPVQQQQPIVEPTTKPEVIPDQVSAPNTSPTPTPVVVPTVAPSLPSNQNNQEVTVYVTKSGKKYHNDGCRFLAKSKSSISLSDAKAQGYTPCSVCNPPQ